MAGWEKLWQDPKTAQRWRELPPVPEVVVMADLLEIADRWRVLDVGCGVGRHVVYLAARGFEVTGTDNSPEAIRVCTQNLAETGLSAKLVETDMTQLPTNGHSFDGAIATYAIHHATRATLQQVIGLITQRLKPSGFFVWVTPSLGHCFCGQGEEIEPGTWVSPEHDSGLPHHYCSEAEIRELLADYDIELLQEYMLEEDGKTYRHWRVLARKK
jgi:tellurite methyltransferase